MKKYFLIFIITLLIINNTNADYKKNINDNVKIYKLEEKINNILEKNKNPKLLKSKILKHIEEILNKNESEIKNNKNFFNLKEYGLTKIYLDLIYKNTDYSKYNILENDYIKVLVTKKNIKIDNEKLYFEDENFKKYILLEFFKIEKNEKTEDFLNKKFNKNKCSIIKSKNNLRIKGIFYYIGKKTEINNTKSEGLSDCGEYGIGWGMNFFYRISDNSIIYTNPSQDYQGFDLSTMEIK